MKPFSKFILLALVCLLFSPSLLRGEVPRYSYEAAASYVRSHYEPETMEERSTAIHKVEFYPAEGQNFMLVYFVTNKAKGYIYEGVPVSVWQGWKNAPSKGKYYRAAIKGRYGFQLERDSKIQYERNE